MNKFLLFISCLLVLSTTHAFFDPWGSKNFTQLENDVIDFDELFSFSDQKTNLNFTEVQNWFTEQKVDHFDVSNQKKWRQRYWAISDYYNKEANGPVLTMISKSHGVGGFEKDKVFILQLAQKFGALILVLEHRFFGVSQPFSDKNITTNRLSYLNVDQVLADWAYFIKTIKEDGKFGVNQTTKFISIGGGYVGALSAWFREKYPYLTVGALASSAIVNSIINFPEFDEEVYSSLMKTGEECIFSIQSLNKYVEDQLYASQNFTNAIDIKELFNASKLTNEEFLYYWSDNIAHFVAAGRRSELCNLLSVYESVEAQFDALRQYITQFGFKRPKDYGSHYLSKKDYDPKKESGRQWAWLRCSELGWFATAPSKKYGPSLRSLKLNISFYEDWCESIFDEEVWPEKGLANLKRGGIEIQATNLIITNGAEDPWKAASVGKLSYPGITTYYIECENCAHNVELYAPKSTDSWKLWWVRQKIKYQISKWLSTSIFMAE